MKNKNIAALEPKNVWGHFYGLTQQPRPSKHEEKVRAFIVAFAKKNKLDCKVDGVGNVIITKPATKGMENRRGVILQAHLDMVPQKNADKKHDFVKDPIEAYVDGDWVTADGTTLGADNGMGCAAIMAVLESKTIKHGPLEALFTIDEETGMTGAFGIKKGMFKGDILLNLDSETEGELYVGCAGGIDATITLPYKTEAVPADSKAFKIALTGLKGGHSGMDIVLGRGNANKLMNRLLLCIMEGCSARLVKLDGGSLRNAIPRESFATVTLPKAKEAKFQKIVEQFYAETKAELSAVEPDYIVKCEKATLPKNVITAASGKKMCRLVYGIPNGVMRMSDAMPIVETSTNMAIVKADKGVLTVSCLLRSSVDTAKEDLVNQMKSVVALAGGKAEFTGGYPGWKPNMQSPILKAMQSTYHSLYGKKPKVMAIHAGLECGLLGGVYKNWDMISFGPTIMYPHSPDEKVNIASVKKFWDYLVATLAATPKK
ncbi:MAG: aminoacyl-histidine dipeptidase [Bacteroidales bacterium]|nr:aminoacyl-histidine dipeptidase [Bacteroidales bacterium]